MNSLREELGATPLRPTPYGILCPPGWRRSAPSELVDGDSARVALERMKAAGRADLVVQTRSMLARFRRSVQEMKVVDLYLPPADPELGPLPAVLMVSPLVRPAQVSWDATLSRLSRGARVDQPEFGQVPMWMWREEGSIGDGESTLRARESHYVVPVAGEEPVARALRFQYTVLVPPGEGGVSAVESLIALGDVMMSTVRWLDPGRAAR